MATLFTNNNLFDSIVNEVEKITHYQQIFSKLSPDDVKLAEEVNYDYDILGFLHCNNQEMLTDKLLRSFIDIEYAIKRNYKENVRYGRNSETVEYSPELMNNIMVITINIDKIFRNKKLYTDEYLESKSIAEHFEEVIEELDIQFKKSNITKKVISADEYLVIIEDLYLRVHKLMKMLKCELESKPYLRQASFVIKYVISLCLTISNALKVVKFE